MHIGMLGTMAQLYLPDLREKTWRGQLGRALQGKIPGGKAYSYDAGGAAGERRIDLGEARIVQRIFEEFADGRSPRTIAKQLNIEHVPGPDGRPLGRYDNQRSSRPRHRNFEQRPLRRTT